MEYNSKFTGQQVDENLIEVTTMENKRYYSIYLTVNTMLYIEENTTSGDLFIKYPKNLNIYMPSKANSVWYSISEVATQVGSSLVKSTKGVDGCLVIPNTKWLCFNPETDKFVLLSRTDLKDKTIRIIGNSSGEAIYIDQGLLRTNKIEDDLRGDVETNTRMIYAGFTAYYANGATPTFQKKSTGSDSGITITFPVDAFRIYDHTGNAIVNGGFENQTYTINSFNQLVYYIESKEIKVVTFSESQKTEYIRLFSLAGGAISGLLASYYRRYVDITYNISNNNITANNIAIVGDSVIIPANGFCLISSDASLYYIAYVSGEDAQDTLILNNESASYTRKYAYIDKTALKKDARASFTKAIVVTNNALGDGYVLLASWYNKTLVRSGLIQDVAIATSISDYNNKLTERNQVNYRSDFSLLFFSDLHKSVANLTRIISLANDWGGNYIDTIINGGDNVSVMSDGFEWYYDIVGKSKIDVLPCVGNHDAWVDTWKWADKKNVYDAYLGKVNDYVDGIIQPQNASADGLLYYYKDYGKVRVIVIDGMFVDNTNYYWDNAEKQWFLQALEDARQNNKAVICVTHSSFKATDAVVDENITFNNWVGYKKDLSDNHTTIAHDPICVTEEALECVDTFINNGGKFICWLSGHTHMDNFVYSLNHPKQLAVVIASASCKNGSDCVKEDNSLSSMYDCMNYIGIDLNRNVIKILRVGMNYDGMLRKKNVLVYDLAQKKVIANY